MMHTAACHIRMPAYRHKTNTRHAHQQRCRDTYRQSPSPPFTADSVARSGWLSGVEAAARLAAQPPDAEPALLAHSGHLAGQRAARAHRSPLRHPVNLRPMLITSRHRSLAFRKVRSAKNAALPGYHRFRETPRFPSGQPRLIPVGNGAARLYSVVLLGPIGRGPAQWR